MNPQELAGFLEELDVLGRMIQEDRDLFPSGVGQIVSAGLAAAYGLGAEALAKLGWKEWMDVGLVSTYLTLLTHIGIGLRNAAEVYGVKLNFSNLRFVEQLTKAARQTKQQPCFPTLDQVNHFPLAHEWLPQSIEKSLGLYRRYLNSSALRPAVNTLGVATLWPDRLRPVNANLDTNLLSAEGEYKLADECLTFLKTYSVNAHQNGLPFVDEFLKRGAEHRAAYFSSANVGHGAVLETQIRSLDGLNHREEQEAIGSVGPDYRLPQTLPKFGTIGEGPCSQVEPSFVELADGVVVQIVGPGFVCLPKDATLLQAWVGALVAAGAKLRRSTSAPPTETLRELEEFYLESVYAHSRKSGSPTKPYAKRCAQMTPSK